MPFHRKYNFLSSILMREWRSFRRLSHSRYLIRTWRTALSFIFKLPLENILTFSFDLIGWSHHEFRSCSFWANNFYSQFLFPWNQGVVLMCIRQSRILCLIRLIFAYCTLQSLHLNIFMTFNLQFWLCLFYNW